MIEIDNIAFESFTVTIVIYYKAIQKARGHRTDRLYF